MSTAPPIYVPPEPTIFERIITGGDVETWCLNLLRRWVGTYLSEVERQHGREAGHWQRPRAFTRTLSFDKWPEDQLPALMLISTGITTAPRRGGSGQYSADWLMLFGCLCSAKTQEQAHDMAHDYCAAVRTLILQRPSLDGFADGATWAYEQERDLRHDDLRSLSAVTAAFTVHVENIASGNAGPVTPDNPLPDETEPWPLWPTVATHDVTIVKEEEVQHDD